MSSVRRRAVRATAVLAGTATLGAGFAGNAVAVPAPAVPVGVPGLESVSAPAPPDLSQVAGRNVVDASLPVVGEFHVPPVPSTTAPTSGQMQQMPAVPAGAPGLDAVRTLLGPTSVTMPAADPSPELPLMDLSSVLGQLPNRITDEQCRSAPVRSPPEPRADPRRTSGRASGPRLPEVCRV